MVAGRAGLVHARNYGQNVPTFSLAVMADANLDEEQSRPCTALAFRRASGGTSFDAVCIATPNFSQGGWFRAAAKQRKHLFCEKPMALTVGEAEEAFILAASKKAMKVLITP